MRRSKNPLRITECIARPTSKSLQNSSYYCHDRCGTTALAKLAPNAAIPSRAPWFPRWNQRFSDHVAILLQHPGDFHRLLDRKAVPSRLPMRRISYLSRESHAGNSAFWAKSWHIILCRLPNFTNPHKQRLYRTQGVCIRALMMLVSILQQSTTGTA